MAHAEPEETLNHALASALPAGTPTEARRRLAVVAAGVLFAAFSVWINYEDDPDLLILDEPTSSLDPLARREFSAVLRELKARGKTILVSSHLLSEVEAICDRVAILKDGAVARSGPLDELLATASVRIHVRRVPPEIIEPLVALGGEVAVAGADTTVRCRDGAVRASVVAALEAHGVPIERIETETRPLEELFVETVAA